MRQHGTNTQGKVSGARAAHSLDVGEVQMTVTDGRLTVGSEIFSVGP